MSRDYSSLAIFFFACLIVRSGYEWLREKRRIDPASKSIFIIVLIAMIGLWVSWFALCPIDPVRVELPGTIRAIGLMLFIAGLVFAFGALIQLRGVEDIDHLVVGGFFTITPHPMYTGFLLWIGGWIIYHGAAVSIVPGLLLTANIIYWSRLEEKRLTIQFGDAYSDYRRRTWF